MSMIVAVVLIAFGWHMRRRTVSDEWRIVANAAITMGAGFLALFLLVMVFAFG
jgi:uncharacterized membrane protein